MLIWVWMVFLIIGFGVFNYERIKVNKLSIFCLRIMLFLSFMVLVFGVLKGCNFIY